MENQKKSSNIFKSAIFIDKGEDDDIEMKHSASLKIPKKVVSVGSVDPNAFIDSDDNVAECNSNNYGSDLFGGGIEKVYQLNK